VICYNVLQCSQKAVPALVLECYEVNVMSQLECEESLKSLKYSFAVIKLLLVSKKSLEYTTLVDISILAFLS
jgi:hypothetical protein